MYHLPTTPPAQPQAQAQAGPSRLPKAVDHTSPRRSTSLTHRQRQKMPAAISVLGAGTHLPPEHLYPSLAPSHGRPSPRPHPNGPTSAPRLNGGTPGQYAQPSPTIRRASSNDGRSRAYTTPSSRSPVKSGESPEAALLQHVREKMSSQDQEAMSRVRTMMAAQAERAGAGAGAGAGRDPLSPTGDRFPRVSPEGALLDRRGKGVAGMRRDSPEREREQGGGFPFGPGRDGAERDAERTPRPPDRRERSPAQNGAPFRIAVIGQPGVGKSTAIRRGTRAWGGVSEPTQMILSDGGKISSCRSSVESGTRLKEAHEIEFLEMDLSLLDTSPDSPTAWPDGVNGVSGVILCYDATQSSTLEGITQALSRLSTDNLPMIIMACKSDPGAKLEVEAAYGNSLGEAYNVGLIEVTEVTEEGKSKMRNGMRWLLYKLEQRSRMASRDLSQLNLRKKTFSTATAAASRQQSAEYIKPLPPDTGDVGDTGDAADMNQHSPNLTESEYQSSAGGHDRVLWGHQRNGSAAEAVTPSQRSSGGSLGWIVAAPIVIEGDGGVEGYEDKGQEGEAQEEVGEAEIQAGSVDLIKVESNGSRDQPDQLWLSVRDLYRKVFSSMVTKENEQLVSSFFLTYRRFSTPLDFMREFQIRFEEVAAATLAKDLKMIVLQRLTGALVDWACEYPGDITPEPVQAVYREILASTLRHRFLSHLAAEMVAIESELYDVDDIDTSWSYDSLPHRLRSQSHSSASASAPACTANTSPSQLVIDGRMLNELDNTPTSARPRPHSRPASMESARVASSSAPSLVGSNISMTSEEIKRTSLTRLHQQRSGSESRLYVNGNGNGNGDGSSNGSGSGSIPPPMPLPPSNGMNDYGFARWSTSWNTFMRYDPKLFAGDLTKLQWRLFSVIRPRDVFRHDFGGEKQGSVGEAIEFFNHMSRWVSTMILANPKPKHRARTLERFILITHHLRRLNNYDSLYAVLSGMRETSIHRLSATHALVNTLSPGYKELGEYVELMDPRGGYAAYGRAIREDTARSAPAIPLMTVMLGQINRLQSVRPVDRREDGCVQWDKFTKFGQILEVITQCQERGAVVPGEPSPYFQALLDNTRVIDSEDALFERSRLLEPPNGVPVLMQGGGGVMKKLANLGMGGAFDGRAEM